MFLRAVAVSVGGSIVLLPMRVFAGCRFYDLIIQPTKQVGRDVTMMMKCTVCRYEEQSQDPHWQCPKCRYESILNDIDTRSTATKNLVTVEYFKILLGGGIALLTIYSAVVGELNGNGRLGRWTITWSSEPVQFIILACSCLFAAFWIIKSGILKLKEFGGPGTE